MSENRRKRDSAKLVWDSKPKRAPNPKDIEFQTAELVIPNAAQANQFNLPLFNQPQAGVTSLFPGQIGELPLGGQDIDKSQMNRLIWGDNLLAMQALLAQGYAGKIDLIYIDPPFLSSADYNFQLSVEGKQIDKEASIIERLAYTDTWEGGIDSFLDMLYPRLQLIKRLLSENGSLYIHVDWHISHYIKVLMDEVFGYDNFINEIIWKRISSHNDTQSKYSDINDNILFYSKSSEMQWNPQYLPLSDELVEKSYRYVDENGKKYRLSDISSPSPRPNMMYEWKGFPSPPNGWRYSKETMKDLDEKNKIFYPDDKSKRPRLKAYLEESQGILLSNLWTDLPSVQAHAKERLGYPTQKSEALLERIIKASSNEGDLVADFFCGSGTTMAVADRLNRRWIGCNLDKVGLQVSRNRLVAQQSSPFLLENIGNYQRQMIYLSGSKIGEMQRIILKLYGAQARTDRPDLGVRNNEDGSSELVYVGYPDRPTTAKKVMELAKDAEVLDGTGYKNLVILAWDYDYNFSTDLENYGKTRRTKTDIQPLTIPPEIYNYLKKAKNEDDLEGLRDKLVFHEKPYLKVSHSVTDAGEGQVMLSVTIDRYVLLNFPVPEKQQEELRKVIKDNFAVLIDYWAVDWDYDGKLFKSQWQAIRGNGKRTHTVVTSVSSLPMKSGKRSIAIRLVDIFGNDASATINFNP
jgi:adenine-specific DNA-methyltransferase